MKQTSRPTFCVKLRRSDGQELPERPPSNCEDPEVINKKIILWQLKMIKAGGLSAVGVKR